MTKIRLLIVDDHAILRSGLKMLVNSQPDMEVVGEADTARGAFEQIAAEKPDVVILDITMPEMSGLKALEKIRVMAPESRVLVLTMHDDPAYLRSVLAAGGAGYVVKRSADSELLSAIRAVRRGKIFIDRTLGDEIVHDLLGSRSVEASNILTLLSKREREVLELLAQGCTNRQVADVLNLSVKTAETYRARVYQKLGFRDRASLIRFCVENEILTPDRLL
jgi:two-component system, NarL family, response regulator NreC